MKQVLITGATSGLGLEFTHYYASRGYHVHLLGRNNDKLLELKAQYQDKAEVNLYCIDLGNDDQLNHWLNEIKDIDYDIVINNAGFGDYGEFVESDINKQEYMIKTNCIALTKIAHTVLNNMKKRNYGYLLNVGSLAGFMPGPMMSVYYATKAYVLTFTEAIAQELKGSGVQVSLLAPGPTKTQFNKNANTDASSLIEVHSKGFNLLHSGDPKEVALEGIKGMNRNKRIIIPYLQNKLLATLVRFVPRSWVTEAQVQIMRIRHGKATKSNEQPH